MDLNKITEYIQSPEGKAHYARIIINSRIDDITYGLATGNLDLDQARKLLKEIYADQQEVK